MIAQADSRKWMACLYNSFLFMEAKIMKMAKKLLAVVLTGVMAVSMLTGCAMGDAVKEKAMFEQLKLAGKNNTTETVYKQDEKANNVDDTHKTAYDLKSALTAAKAAVKENAKTKDAAGVENAAYTAVKGTNTVAAFVYVVELPDSANKKDSWYSIASELNTKLINASTGAFQKANTDGTKNTIVVNYDIVSCNVRKDASKETPTEKASFLVVVAAPHNVNG